MKVVSFLTGQPKYVEQAARLRASCDRFKLPHRIQQLELPGSWANICNLKPQFLLQMMLAIRGPILWCDVDCEILRETGRYSGIKLAEEFGVPYRYCDFGIYNWRADREVSQLYGGYDPSKLLSSSGVVYLDYTAPVMELLLRWADACAETPHIVDDQVLDRVWASNPPPVKPLWFPRTMNWMVGHYGPPTADCIIRHDYQAKADHTLIALEPTR